ncbi:hypothetical protein J2W56_002864 [Nocardia kruczakiae]|uniref:MmyB-like transcription regulator ligand binding domain-containing protein n=1 Tax=Nocardia kruczakiae TaxID=261477 RepID=A0ABU1XF07_9NOCA|nr:DUF5994 family protein [Nocardia kruczakiae]MDR7169123.1 hypothetical protein [Nocardia kruczakiae]
MTPHSTSSHPAPARHPPLCTPRLRVRPRRDGTGRVDGVWWPRTQDLAAELPGLLTVLRPRLGPVRQIVYDPTGWLPSSRHLQLGSHRIRLDPYRFELFNRMDVCSAHGIVVMLRVVLSTTDDTVANAALAAVPGVREGGRS